MAAVGTRSPRNESAEGWRAKRDGSGRTIYVNEITKEQATTKPDEMKELEADPSGWQEVRVRKGGKVLCFYKHKVTGSKEWKLPGARKDGPSITTTAPSSAPGTASPPHPQLHEGKPTPFPSTYSTGAITPVAEGSFLSSEEDDGRRTANVDNMFGRDTTRPHSGRVGALRDTASPAERSSVLPPDSPSRRVQVAFSSCTSPPNHNDLMSQIEVLSAERNVEAELRRKQESRAKQLEALVMEQQERLSQLERSRRHKRSSSESSDSPRRRRRRHKGKRKWKSRRRDSGSSDESDGDAWHGLCTPTGIPYWYHPASGATTLTHPDPTNLSSPLSQPMTRDQAYALARDICDSVGGPTAVVEKAAKKSVDPRVVAKRLLQKYVAESSRQALPRSSSPPVVHQHPHPQPYTVDLSRMGLRPMNSKAAQPTECEVVLNLTMQQDPYGRVVLQPTPSQQEAMDVALNVYLDKNGNVVQVQPGSTPQPSFASAVQSPHAQFAQPSPSEPKRKDKSKLEQLQELREKERLLREESVREMVEKLQQADALMSEATAAHMEVKNNLPFVHADTYDDLSVTPPQPAQGPASWRGGDFASMMRPTGDQARPPSSFASRKDRCLSTLAEFREYEMADTYRRLRALASIRPGDGRPPVTLPVPEPSPPPPPPPPHHLHHDPFSGSGSIDGSFPTTSRRRSFAL